MKALKIIIAVVLILQGLIHFMGTAAYLQLADVQELPYKTTVLFRRWDLGEVGIAVLGVLWAVIAIGFVITTVAFLLNPTWWKPALLWVTLFSLVLTFLDWEVAKTGVIVNLMILTILGVSTLLKSRNPSLENAVRR